MRPRYRSALPALALSAVLALAGCGSDETGDPPSPDSAVEQGAATLQVRPVEESPTTEQQGELDDLDCGAERPTAQAEDPMVACGPDGTPYAMGPAIIDGGVDRVDQMESDTGDWSVDVTLDQESTQALAAATQDLAGTGSKVAVVFEGQVLIAPEVESELTKGQFQINGSLSQGEATDLGNRIQAGG